MKTQYYMNDGVIFQICGDIAVKVFTFYNGDMPDETTEHALSDGGWQMVTSPYNLYNEILLCDAYGQREAIEMIFQEYYKATGNRSGLF